ncbi:hypothetical protein HPB47_008181 [Ixodes persulcatus]|uniref:Uncharacterized protein n=1 Tax=Ixodes persulcatus TaxID=34615 RepID=A0AC60P5U3_IXOPE|nr:hypothetical protein HPB47_008181 [Ixodes persulcatus]
MGNATSVDSSGKKHQLREKTIRDIYMESKKDQSTLGIKALDLRKMSFSTKSNACQQLIYVGEGTGESTRQELLPFEQPRSETVATDTSQEMAENAKENLEQSQAIKRFIPSTEDVEDKSELKSYMLGVLEGARLQPRTIQVLTNEQSCLDVDEFIQMMLSVDSIQPLLPEEAKAEFKTDVEEVMRTFWTEELAGHPQFLLDIFVVHAIKI